VLSDVQNDYYDYQDDFATATAFHLHFPGTPLSTTTITQTLTLQTGATIHDTGRRIESRAAANALLGRLAGVRAALELHNARARDARIMHFTSFMLRGSVKGGLR
jgi:hypothetical protein